MVILIKKFKENRDQNGGYTKVVPLAKRQSDDARMAYIEYNGK